MIKIARAFAPANISCIFKIYEHPDPLRMGSYGVGFTLEQGVIAEALLSTKTEVFFNTKKLIFPAVTRVIKQLTKKNVRIALVSKLPLGCGFGLSGASALATAYSLNRLLALRKSNKELALRAHVADVESRTGLGDVVNQYYGGLLVKFKPSSQFVVKRIPHNNMPVYCTCFSKLSTRSIITNPKLRTRINESGTIALGKLQYLFTTVGSIAFKELITLSKEFAVSSGLLTDKKVIETIKHIEQRNGYASMIMLGNAVFSDIPFQGSIKLSISDQGAYTL